MTFKFDGWPRKIIGHLFYTTSSFVHHFKSISKFKLELQSGNAQFGSKLMIFLAVWPRNLTDDLEKQLGTSSMLLQAFCIILWPTMSQFYIHYINAKFRHNLFHKYTDIHIGIFWFTVPHVQINKQKVHFNTSKPGFNKNTLETCKNPRPTSGWSELTKSYTTSTMNFHMAYFFMNSTK